MATIKKLWKPFVILFLIIFIAANWSNISWIFNYQVLSRFISGFWSEKTEPEQIATTTIANNNQDSRRENSLEIPSLDVAAPLTVDNDLYDWQVYKALDNGVAYYPEFGLAGKIGQTVILGHSAPLNWPDIKYDGVFSHINELIAGDEIIIYYDNQKFTYQVIDTIFLEKGENIPENKAADLKNFLIIISCWPPGKDVRRIAVRAELTE